MQIKYGSDSVILIRTAKNLILQFCSTFHYAILYYKTLTDFKISKKNSKIWAGTFDEMSPVKCKEYLIVLF